MRSTATVAPLGCRAPWCAHCIEYLAAGEIRHRCDKDLPLHEPCASHETPDELRLRARRDDALRFMGSGE